MPKSKYNKADKSTLHNVKCNTCYKCGRFFTSKNPKLCLKMINLHLQRCNVAPMSEEQNDAINSKQNIYKHWKSSMGGGKLVVKF